MYSEQRTQTIAVWLLIYLIRSHSRSIYILWQKHEQKCRIAINVFLMNDFREHKHSLHSHILIHIVAFSRIFIHTIFELLILFDYAWSILNFQQNHFLSLVQQSILEQLYHTVCVFVGTFRFHWIRLSVLIMSVFIQ